MESESDDEFFDADEDFKSSSASPKKEENVEPEQEISAVKKVEDRIKNSSNNSVIDTRKEFQDMIDKDHEITEIQTKPRTPPLNRDVAGTPEKVGESETDFKTPKVYIEEDMVDEICTFNEPDSLKIAATDVNCSIVTSESHEPQSLEKTKSELEIISENNNIKKAEVDKSEEVNPNTSQTSLKQESTDITETPETKNPVAPPRRKKKQGKLQGPPRPPPPRPGDPPQRLAPSTNAGDAAPPCIKVSGSHNNEMNKILQQGSSLDVVYNVDTQANKSEGGMGASATGTLSTPKKLTDDEILEQVVVKNLDTGETIPLSKAEEKIPEGMSPLALHIMRLTIDDESEFVEMEEDGHLSDTSTTSSLKATGKRKKLKKFFGEAVQKIKHVADEVKAMRAEESSEEEEDITEGGYIKFKNHRLMKEKLSFSNIKLLQDLTGDHIGAIWTMKFSLCGKLLATAGQDNIVRVWVLNDAYSNFEEMRLKYSRPGGNNNGGGRTSPTGSMISANSVTSADEDPCIPDLLLANGGDEEKGPFKTTPFVAYHGHTSDVLDLSWSKNFFLLSSSMDKTVRLWHISRQECLCCFQHVDFVTAICFHPRDDRYFLSGSLDGKIRLWNIPEKKVALWNEIDGSGTSLITAANFCQNGKLAVVGTYDGRCIFYDTERLKYHTQITVRSSRGKNARGRKISGIEPMPGQDKVLITSNDSRIRLYDLKDHSLYCKYKGLHNESSQIRASFSHDGELILCGSEDKFVHIWRTEHGIPNVRKDRNEYYESFSAHEAVVTAAIFAPYPAVILPDHTTSKENDSKLKENDSNSKTPFDVLVSADWQGGIKLYVNR